MATGSSQIYRGIFRIPIGLVIPCLLITIACIIPLAYLILKSLGAGSDSWAWLFRINTLMIFWRSIILAFSVTTTCILIAVPIALLITKFDLRGKRIWEVVTLLPLVIPSYVGAYLLMSSMGPKGLVQQTLHPFFGIERMPSIYGFVGALITLSLLNFPYVLLTIRGTINQLDPAQEESSRLLGLNRLQTLMKVTLPQLRPAIISGGLLVSLYTLSDFGAVSLMRYKTFTWSIYNQYGASFDMNAAALLSISLCALATLIVYVESFIRGNKKYFNTSTGAPRSPRVMKLGVWQVPSQIFCFLITVFSLGVPTSILCYWLFRGISSGESIINVLESTVNSLILASATSVCVIVVVLPVSYLVVRYGGIFATIVEKSCFVGFALPSIAVSLSLVFLGSRIGHPIYQSMGLLIFACVLLYLPTGLGSVKSSLLHISPRLEESSKTLGNASLRTYIKVTLPLLKPSILMGVAIVFLVTMKELPAVLMLSPLDFHTLTTDIWTYSSEAFFAKAAVPSLTLLLVSSIPLTLVMLKSGLRG